MSEEEIWKDIDGYEGLYQVSDLGRVRSLDRHVVFRKKFIIFKGGKIIQPDNSVEYPTTCLCKDGKTKRIRVHQLVAHYFIPNPENKPQINHKDGDKKNNNKENLEWVTAKENMRHAFANDLMPARPKGSDSKLSKLTDEKVIEIRRLLSDKTLNQSQIASLFNVKRLTINRIHNGKNWTHL